MRALLWITAIFALGAGLVVAARYDAGYVLLVLPPYRVELSLNLFVLLLLLGYAFAYGFARIIVTAVQLPARVRDYRAARRERREHDALVTALREWLAGRYAKAEQAAANIVLPEYVGVASVLAAKAAHELRAYERRDAYVAKAKELAPQEETIRIVAEAQFLLNDARARDALATLRLLPRKHTAALRLELRAQQALRNWEQVLPIIDQLEKRNVLDAVQAAHGRRRAIAEGLKAKSSDAATLAEGWKKVPAAMRADPYIAAAAAQAYLSIGDGMGAQRIIETGLAQNWNTLLIGLYGECSGDTVKQIERAEKWLEQQPRDAALLLALSRLCRRQGLWGKAQSYVDASLSVEPTCEAHLEAARLKEDLGQNDAARRHYHDSLELALARLQELQALRASREGAATAPVTASQTAALDRAGAFSRLSAAE